MNRRELLKKIGLVGLIPVVLPGMILQAQQGTSESEGHGGTVVLTGGNLAVDEVKKHFIENGWARKKNSVILRSVFVTAKNAVFVVPGNKWTETYELIILGDDDNTNHDATVSRVFYGENGRDKIKNLVRQHRAFEYDVVYSKGERAYDD